MADDLPDTPPPPADVPILWPADETVEPPAVVSVPPPPDWTAGAMAVFVAVVVGYAGLLGAAWFAHEEVGRFALTGLEALPFLALALFAYAGERNTATSVSPKRLFPGRGPPK